MTSPSGSDLVTSIDDHGAFQVLPNVRYVNKSGNDALADGSEALPFLTIKAAISGTLDEGVTTLSIGPGTYVEDSDTVLVSNINYVGDSYRSTFVYKSDLTQMELTGSSNPVTRIEGITFSYGLKVNYTGSGRLLARDVKVNLDEFNSDNFTIACVANVAGVLAGKYFLVDSALNNWYFWFTSSSAGADPAIAGRVGVQIDLVDDDDAETVAAKIASFSDLQFSRYQYFMGFSVGAEYELPAGSVNYSSNLSLPFTSPSAGTSGFTFSRNAPAFGTGSGTGYGFSASSSSGSLFLDIADCDFSLTTPHITRGSGNIHDSIAGTWIFDTTQGALSLKGTRGVGLYTKGNGNLFIDSHQLLASLPAYYVSDLTGAGRVNVGPTQQVVETIYFGDISSGTDLVTNITSEDGSPALVGGKPSEGSIVYGADLSADTRVSLCTDLPDGEMRISVNSPTTKTGAKFTIKSSIVAFNAADSRIIFRLSSVPTSGGVVRGPLYLNSSLDLSDGELKGRVALEGGVLAADKRFYLEILPAGTLRATNPSDTDAVVFGVYAADATILSNDLFTVSDLANVYFRVSPAGDGQFFANVTAANLSGINTGDQLAAAVANIPTPAIATPEDCANKINELLASLRAVSLLNT